MFSDLRYASRQLKRNPGFAAVAILTLALGIGACTAIFSVVNGVLLQPFDYPHSEQIVVIRETDLPKFPKFAVSPPNYLDWVKQTKSWRYLSAYSKTEINLTGEGEPQRLVFAASRLMSSMLFQTSAHDPLTFSLTTLLLTAVAFAACLLPARRATRVNPIEALRTE